MSLTQCIVRGHHTGLQHAPFHANTVLQKACDGAVRVPHVGLLISVQFEPRGSHVPCKTRRKSYHWQPPSYCYAATALRLMLWWCFRVWRKHRRGLTPSSKLWPHSLTPCSSWLTPEPQSPSRHPLASSLTATHSTRGISRCEGFHLMQIWEAIL